jgi:hypothetical protein
MYRFHDPLHNYPLTYVFKAGLFSAVGAVSLVESYKWLSPDSGDQTVELLNVTVNLITQLSQQLVNISQGIPVEDFTVESSEPFQQTFSALMVNIIWFSSIVICIGCAVFATLIQQWARRYLALTQGAGTPYERAQLRRFLSKGLKTFQAERIRQLLGMLMHLSLLLYSVGLIVFIFHIDRQLVFMAVGYISCCFLIYVIPTVLPFFFLNCPFNTPFTAITWRLYHLLMFGLFSIILGIVTLPHALLTLGHWSYRPVSGSRGWVKDRVDKHKREFLDGLRRTIKLRAKDATSPECPPTDIVENNSEKEVEDFAIWVLEFFDTYARSGAEETILSLTSDQPSTNSIFCFRLHRLLKIYIVGTSALAEEQRRGRLRVCLECLWYWARAYSQNSASLPFYFPLPNSDMIRRLQTEQDPTAAIIARCLCALVAKELAADINSRQSSDRCVRDTKLESLSAILGRTRTEMETFLRQPGAFGLANIVSLTSGVMKTLFTEEVSSTELLSIFRATVDILSADDTLTSLNTDLPPNVVSSFHNAYANAQRPQTPDWLRRQLWPISERLFVVSDVGRTGGGFFIGQV